MVSSWAESASKVSKATLEKRLVESCVPANLLKLIDEYPEIKGDYRQTYWRYLREFHGCKISFNEFKPFFELLRACPSPETVVRAYRKLVETARREFGEESEEFKRVAPLRKTLAKRALNASVYREQMGRRELGEFEVEGEAGLR